MQSESELKDDEAPKLQDRCASPIFGQFSEERARVADPAGQRKVRAGAGLHLSVAAPSGDREVRRDGMGRERVLAAMVST